MLKQIHRVACSDALASCRQLMQKLVLWLADANVSPANVSEANLTAYLQSPIEASWLWSFLQHEVGSRALLERAQNVAALSGAEKMALRAWAVAVGDVAQQFANNPPHPLPTGRPIGVNSKDAKWVDLKVLLIDFYETGFASGLPYSEDGTPTADVASRVTRELFLKQFREAHRTVQDEDAREVCVLCGGELVKPQADHWVLKSSFPLLAICDTNLLPCCSDCNEGPNKGRKKVYTGGSFSDWYHPYLRHPQGSLQLGYDNTIFQITLGTTQPGDAPKVANLDALLNLRTRWTKEFKAEDTKVRRQIADMRLRGMGPNTRTEVEEWLTHYRDALLHSEPDFEIHVLVAEALLDPHVIAALTV